MADPKFTEGDLVRHRASGQIAVVMRARTYAKHTHECALKFPLPSIECSCSCGAQYKFTGEYDLSTGFGQETVADELELKMAAP